MTPKPSSHPRNATPHFPPNVMPTAPLVHASNSSRPPINQDALKSVFETAPLQRPASVDVDSTPIVQKNVKRFVSLNVYDKLLEKCVLDHDAHEVSYSGKIARFDTERAAFIEAAPLRVVNTHEIPSSNSIRDRFMRLKERRRETTCELEPLFRNSETLSNLEAFLDDVILRRD